MLLTKVLVSLQILHYYSISAHPISSSKLLVKRAPVGGYHVGKSIEPSIDEEGLAAVNLDSSREAGEASVTERIHPADESVHEEGPHSKKVQDIASPSVSHEKNQGDINPEILEKAKLLLSIDAEDLKNFLSSKLSQISDEDEASSGIGLMQLTSMENPTQDLSQQKLKNIFSKMKTYFEEFLDNRKVDGNTSRTIYSDEVIESLFDVWTYGVIGPEDFKKGSFDISKLSILQSKMLSEIKDASHQSRNPEIFARFENLMANLDLEQKFFLWVTAFWDVQDEVPRNEIQSLYDLLAGSLGNPKMKEDVLEAIELINLQFKRVGVELFNKKKCDLEYLRKDRI